MEDKPKEVDIYFDQESGIIKVGEFETDVSMDVSEDGTRISIEVVDARIDKFLKDIEDVNFRMFGSNFIGKLRNISYSYYTEGFSHKSYYGFRNIDFISTDIYLMVTNYIPN